MPWLYRFFHFLASFTTFVMAGAQCRTEISIPGMALDGFVFKRMSVTAPHQCDFSCEREVTCQSYNYVIGEKICELNNRTKEARPENFRSDPARFYKRRLVGRGMWLVLFFHGETFLSRWQDTERAIATKLLLMDNFNFAVPLGSIPELPAISCREIKASEGKYTINNKYWLDRNCTGQTELVNCSNSVEGEFSFVLFIFTIWHSRLRENERCLREASGIGFGYIHFSRVFHR